jgi:acyl dehydratase
MTIVYENAMALHAEGLRAAYAERDLILYALGIGFGSDPLNRHELPFVYEKGLKAMPTYLVYSGIAAHALFSKIDFDVAMMVHGEQKIEIHRSMPGNAELEIDARVKNVFDKGAGKGAVIMLETDVRLQESGEPLCQILTTLFARGDGGFLKPGQVASGEQPVPHVLPDRRADRVVSFTTRPDQALLYRLSGDLNPLHADPDVATMAGFERPILHGLCTYGICCRAIVMTMTDADPTRIASLQARFSAPVLPGETIDVELWRDGDVVSFVAKVKERGVVAVNNGKAVLRSSLSRVVSSVT